MKKIPKPLLTWLSLLSFWAVALAAGEPLAGNVKPSDSGPSRFAARGQLLLEAAAKNDMAGVKNLLAMGADINFQTDAGTPLALAVKEGHAEMVRFLLAAGADVNAKLKYGDPLIILAAGPSIPDMNPPPDAPPVLPSSRILQLLLTGGIDVNARGFWGKTALMVANSAEKAQCLAAGGADINAADQDGQTALMTAAKRGDPKVVAVLLASGADGNAVNSKGDTALICALDRTRFHSAESIKEVTEIVQSLLAAHVQVNVQNKNGETALLRAAMSNDGRLVRLLLAGGADANACDVLGNSAAVFAYEKGDGEIEKLLSEAATQKPTLLTLNAFLRAAIEKMDAVKVRELLQAGADPNYIFPLNYDQRNIKCNVLVLAAKRGHPGIVQLLLDKGADAAAQGLVAGSEHGLTYGTAMQAAEYYHHAGVISVLQAAKHEKR